MEVTCPLLVKWPVNPNILAASVKGSTITYLPKRCGDVSPASLLCCYSPVILVDRANDESDSKKKGSGKLKLFGLDVYFLDT